MPDLRGPAFLCVPGDRWSRLAELVAPPSADVIAANKGQLSGGP